MSIALFLKDNVKNVPPDFGKLINHIPYSFRPGLSKVYTLRTKEILTDLSLSSDEKKHNVFTRIKNLVDYSYENIPFYFEHYNKLDFHPNDLTKFEDIQKIPIVNKSILNQYSLEKRSSNIKDKYQVNTGGSTGSPFSFYIQPNSMGHEWAHMHIVWQELGYKPSDFKLLFGGRSDLKEVIEYDVVRNHFALNIYADYKIVAKKLKAILKKHTIKFLHGYPSSIYDFALFCRDQDHELLFQLSKNLKGVFYGSEYPHQLYRDTVEEVFKVKTISWYGHTERAILAYEKHEKYRYEPFLTYGFAEGIQDEAGDYQLIGTNYYNYASPLIRYNTNDTISNPIITDGILTSFNISKGRDGDFIIDKNNKKLNLTGLIFGRHHEIFNHANFIQVKQVELGKIEIHFVSDSISVQQASSLFDSRNLNLDLIFIKRDVPLRTNSGKINLLIK
jgi:phenylacetate-CoA ligase